MIQQITEIFRFSALFLIVLITLSIWQNERKSLKKKVLIAFLLINISVLLNYWQPVVQNTILFNFFLFFTVLFPVIFWLLSKVLFDDHFKWSRNYTIICVSSHIVLYSMYILNGTIDNKYYQYFRSLPYIITFFFIFLVVYESFKNRKSDLVTIRLRARLLFITFATLVSFLTVFYFFTQNPFQLPIYLEFIKNSFIILFLILFFYHIVELKPIFKAQTDIKNKVETPQQESILSKILNEIEVNKAYKIEGFTISMLSKLILEKEYIVRKTINGNLGYQNFNIFINHYRIKEACKIISQKSKEMTFQEIAYHLGYKSTATFNRAFKNELGITPSEFAEGKK